MVKLVDSNSHIVVSQLMNAIKFLSTNVHGRNLKSGNMNKL